MVDFLSKQKRSQVMSRIRSKDTRPELLIRSTIHKLGYRYSLHRKDIFGEPDLVFTKYNTVVFINGCFWHQHKGCKEGRIPDSNKDYWEPKLLKTVKRDKRNRRRLKAEGWKVLVIWDCEIRKNLNSAVKKIISNLI